MVRKLLLTLHVTSSVGWIGAVVAFFGLSVIGLTSDVPATVRGAYLVMAPAAWYVLIPLALASLATGVIVSLVTPWGLLRHYWVIFKLLITAFATLVLFTYMPTFRQMAAAAADPTLPLESVRNPSPIVHSVLALVILLIATVLGIYKPPAAVGDPRTPGWVKVFGSIAVLVGAAYVLAHLAGGPARHMAH